MSKRAAFHRNTPPPENDYFYVWLTGPITVRVLLSFRVYRCDGTHQTPRQKYLHRIQAALIAVMPQANFLFNLLAPAAVTQGPMIKREIRGFESEPAWSSRRRRLHPLLYVCFPIAASKPPPVPLGWAGSTVSLNGPVKSNPKLFFFSC